MWRAIGRVILASAGVILGYGVMIGVLYTFSIAFLAMGVIRAFEPDSYEMTTLWIVLSFVLGLIAALAGGVVCASIASFRTALVLARLVLMIGLFMTLLALMEPDQGQLKKRGEEFGDLEVLYIKQPAWVVLLNSLVAAVGIVGGARLKYWSQPTAK